MKRLTAAAALALLVIGLGAGPSPRKLRRGYLRAAEDQTRELFVHVDFSTALILRGTYLDADFRRTLAEERRRLMDPTAEDHARFLERMARDAEAYHEVVFSADSGMPGPLRFGPGDDRWNVRLLADGAEEPLVTVYQVRTPTTLHRSLYPHLNQWSELWIARFHRSVTAPREVIFHVGGGYGHGELRWGVAP